MAPDLEPLVRLQRHHVPAGPMIAHAPETVAQVQGAMMAGMCLEFDYLADGATDAKWRRVIPLGLIHGPATYLIGKIPGRDLEPVPYRLDRMSEVRVSNQPGAADDDWDLDAWMVPFDEIMDPRNAFNLNLTRYIDTSEPEDIHDIDAHLNGGIPARDVDALQPWWTVMSRPM